MAHSIHVAIRSRREARSREIGRAKLMFICYKKPPPLNICTYQPPNTTMPCTPPSLPKLVKSRNNAVRPQSQKCLQSRFYLPTMLRQTVQSTLARSLATHKQTTRHQNANGKQALYNFALTFPLASSANASSYKASRCSLYRFAVCGLLSLSLSQNQYPIQNHPQIRQTYVGVKSSFSIENGSRKRRTALTFS
jgi:hypothetical protein